MQLLDLIKPLEDMTDEALREHLRNVRNNRNIIRPAAAARAKKKASKGSQGRVGKVENIADGMSAAEKAQLILLLQGEG